VDCTRGSGPTRAVPVSTERRGRTSRFVWWTAVVAIGSVGALGLAACLGDDDRVYEDGGAGPTTGEDATVDAPAEVAPGMDGGLVQDGDAMVVEEMTPADVGPPVDAPIEAPTGQTFSCNGTTVASCANCPNSPVECVFCANDGGHPGICEPKNAYCTAPSGATVCTCPGGIGGNLSLCPAPFQVCTYVGTIGGMFYCETCGAIGSGMAMCKDGGHCNAATGLCN